MIGLAADTSAIERAIEKMARRINEFEAPMADEFSTWQVDDVNRKRAVTNAEPNLVWTLFWNRRYIRSSTQKRKVAMRPISNRPVLRPMLFESLRERMSSLMERELTWR